MTTSPEAGPATQPATTLSPADIRSIFYGIMLAMLLSALDQTIVATAMPTIGRDLGDVEHLPWIVTAYLLASTAVTPLYGKFSDMHGRRVTLLIGIAIFLAGSVACALAPSMLALVLARGLQGLGGGGLIATAQTIVADLVTPRERGRYQVYFGIVFSSASLAGPLLGGFFAESLHWTLIFWINLPLGALAFWLTNSRLKRLPRRERRHRLDVLGAALMSGATVTFMLALSWGGVRYPWVSAPVAALAAASACLWVSFGWRLLTASEPLIPVTVLRDGVVRAAIVASALGMGTYIGLSIFVPIFFETVLGFSARASGLALLPFMVGIVAGSTASGRAMASLTHYKRVPAIGLGVASCGIAGVTAGAGFVPFWALEVMLAAVSVGLGTLMPVATVALQNAVEPGHLGTATATMNFSRQLFGAIVVALFGAVVIGRPGGGEGLTTGILAPGGAGDLSGSFRLLFGLATGGIVLAWMALLAMEERPFRDRDANARTAAALDT